MCSFSNITSNAITAFCWMAFYTIHSVLASDRPKAFIQRKLMLSGKSYRLSYNLFAVATFVSVRIFNSTLPDSIIASLPRVALWVSVICAVTGTTVIAKSLARYSFKEFLGLTGEKPGGPKLSTGGLNSIVRHPIYLGTILLLISYLIYSFTVQSVIFVAISVLYLYVGSGLEERKLIAVFGNEYLNYRRIVPRMIPWSIKKRKPSNF